MKRFDDTKIAVIGGTGNHDLDKHIIEWINETAGTNLSFGHIDFDIFPDQEADFRIKDHEALKNKIVIIFQSAYNDELGDEALTLAYAAKYQYGARLVIMVMPFMLFRRQEHPEKGVEINRNAMFVHDLKCKGVDKIIFCDIHSEETLKNCEREGLLAVNVSGAPIFADRLIPIVEMAKDRKRQVFIYAPDAGSVPRAVDLAKILQVPIIMDMKSRDFSGEVSIIQDDEELQKLQTKYGVSIKLYNQELIQDSLIIIIDDEVSSGKTGNKTGHKLKDLGAAEVIFCATHAVCVPGWKRTFIENHPFSLILFGNTIPRTYKNSTGGKVTTVFMSKVIAQALFKMIVQTEEELLAT
jgi:ribose-phosphate pyrophosphokinase